MLGPQSSRPFRLWAVALLSLFAATSPFPQPALRTRYLIRKYNVHQLDVLGYQGYYAAGIAALACSVLMFVPGPRAGQLENINDAFLQLSNDWRLKAAMTGFVFNAAVFIGSSITLTKYIDSTARVVIEQLRTITVWAISMAGACVRACVGGVLAVASRRPEALTTSVRSRCSASCAAVGWEVFSYIQASGFFMLALGALVYNNYVRWPCRAMARAEPLRATVVVGATGWGGRVAPAIRTHFGFVPGRARTMATMWMPPRLIVMSARPCS